MWIKIKRVIRAGFYGFWRNGFVSLSAVMVMVVTLLVIGSVIFSGAILRSTLDQIKDKVDVNVYFVTDAAEPDILAIQKNIEKLPEVGSVVYVSREEALQNFKKRHENDEYTLQALDELGENPLGATLNIKAKDPSQYASVAEFLSSKSVSVGGIIEKVNYYQNKDAIEKLSKVITSANSLGYALTIFLIFISIIITFNTIRLVIYMSKDEIAVMRLVGASTGYIRAPFFIEGGLYGLVASIITLILFYPITVWLGNTTEGFFVGLNIFDYYIRNFGEIFLLLVGSGVAMGSVSSFFAVRKYLNV